MISERFNSSHLNVPSSSAEQADTLDEKAMQLDPVRKSMTERAKRGSAGRKRRRKESLWAEGKSHLFTVVILVSDAWVESRVSGIITRIFIGVVGGVLVMRKHVVPLVHDLFKKEEVTHDSRKKHNADAGLH